MASDDEIRAVAKAIVTTRYGYADADPANAMREAKTLVAAIDTLLAFRHNLAASAQNIEAPALNSDVGTA